MEGGVVTYSDLNDIKYNDPNQWNHTWIISRLCTSGDLKLAVYYLPKFIKSQVQTPIICFTLHFHIVLLQRRKHSRCAHTSLICVSASITLIQLLWVQQSSSLLINGLPNLSIQAFRVHSHNFNPHCSPLFYFSAWTWTPFHMKTLSSFDCMK